jgi:hypothetical protein
VSLRHSHLLRGWPAVQRAEQSERDGCIPADADWRQALREPEHLLEPEHGVEHLLDGRCQRHRPKLDSACLVFSLPNKRIVKESSHTRQLNHHRADV